MPPKGKKGRQNDWEDEMGEDLTKKDEPTPPADDEPAAAMKGKPKKQGKKKGGAFDDAFDDADDAGAEGRADEDKEVAPAKGDEKGAGAKKGAAGKKAGKKGAFDDALDDDDAAEPAQSAAPAKGGGKGGKKGKGKRFDGSDEDEPAPLVAAPEPVAEAAAPKAKAAAKKAAKKGKGGKGRFDDSDDDDDAPSVAPPEPTAEAAAPKAKAAAKKAAKKGKGGKGRFDESDDDDDAPLPPASAAGGDDDDDESDEEAAVAEPVGKGKSMPKGGFSAVLDTEDLPSDDDDDEPPAPAPARPLASAARGSADGAEPSSASAASEVALPSAPGPIVVRVVACAKHPAADRLAVCQLDSGDASAPVQVVCGGANARPGILAVLIPAGGSVPASGAPIEACAVRGVESAGMLCSAAELNVEPALSGHIVELDHESAAARSLGAGFDSDWLMPWPPLDLSEGKPAFSDLWARIFDAAESVEVLGLTLSAPPPAAPDATPFQIAPKRAAADADAPVVEKKKKKGLFSKLADEPAAAGGVADAAADAADGLALGAQKPSAGKLAALGAAADATAVDARAADATAADEGLGFGGKKKKKAVAADAEPAAAEVAPPPAAPVAAAAESVGFGKKQKGSAGGKVTDAEESVGVGFQKKGSAGGKVTDARAHRARTHARTRTHAHCAPSLVRAPAQPAA
jgi:tRNA-binding EMAP/Myf-like protein